MEYALAIATTFLLFHLSIAAHEGGHIAVGLSRGHHPDEVAIGWGVPFHITLRGVPVRIGVFPMAGHAEFRTLFESQRRSMRESRNKFLVATGGPLASAITALGFYFLAGTDADPERSGLWAVFGVINLLVAVMNLLPIPPLDGWRMVEAGLELRGIYLWRDEEQRARIYRGGFFVAIALMIAALPFLIGIAERV